MNVDLAEIAAPRHTAIVTQELQGAVVGPNAGLAALAKAARREALPNIERLLPAARAASSSSRTASPSMWKPLPSAAASTAERNPGTTSESSPTSGVPGSSARESALRGVCMALACQFQSKRRRPSMGCSGMEASRPHSQPAHIVESAQKAWLGRGKAASTTPGFTSSGRGSSPRARPANRLIPPGGGSSGQCTSGTASGWAHHVGMDSSSASQTLRETRER